MVGRDWRAALAAERAAGRRFGLCLIDPPYSVLHRIEGALAHALPPVLDEGATVIVEGPAVCDPPALDELPVSHRTDRTYGSTRVTLARLGRP